MDFSQGALLAGSLTSAVGVGLTIYGRKQRRAPQLVAGVLLLLTPFAGGGWMVLGSGLLVVLLLFAALRLGL